MRDSQRARGVVSALAAALLVSSTAQGAAFQIEARTEAQAYQIRSYRDTTADAPVLLPRRRVVQYLSLNVFEIVTGEDFGFESNLRIFNDFGITARESQFIDGLRAAGGNLLYANLRFRKGGFDGQLGRQLYIDVMDIMALDGARLRYTLPLGLGLEAYGGLWVKGSSIFSSSVYQPDGTRASDARRIALGAPSANPALDELEPVFGGKVFIEDIFGFGASLGYRRAMLGGKVDLERAAVELRYGRGRGFNILGGLEYDLFLPRLSQIRALARYDQDLFAVMVEAMRFSPVLSADSIWYYFATAPRDEVRTRVDWTPVGPWRFYGQLAVSRYNTEINNAIGLFNVLSDPSLTSPITFGPSLGTAARYQNVRTALDVTYRTGVGGRQVWVDWTAGYRPDSRPWSFDGRLSFASVVDPQNPRLKGNFWGGQVWTSLAMTRAAILSLMLEQNVNPFTRSETKLFFLFDLKATL